MISQKILSYSDFVNMPYGRFKQVEATYYFMLKLKNNSAKDDKAGKSRQEIKDKLSNLEVVKANELDLPSEYLEIFKKWRCKN